MTLDEGGIRVLQQILADDSAALSIEELAFRNVDLDEHEVEAIVVSLAAKGYLTPYDEPTADDVPAVYWTPTPAAVERLRELGMWDEIDVLSDANDALGRSKRIKQIEREKPDVPLLVGV